MKDVVGCDKLRVGANSCRSEDFRMGQPDWSHVQLSPPEYIGREKTTGGIETSKYPEEEKSTEIPVVAASETGRAQTSVYVSLRALLHWGCRTCLVRPLTYHRVTKSADS